MLYRSETESIDIEREMGGIGPREEHEPTVVDYARVVWGGKWMILSLMVAATGVTAVVSLNMPKTFLAQTTIMPLGQERAGGLASALSGSLGGALGIENPADKLMAVFQSRRVAGMVVDTLGLDAALVQATGGHPTRDEAIDAVQNSVIKVTGGNRGLITIRASWSDPALAAAIANAVVAATGRFLNERSISMNFQVLDEAVPPRKPSGPRVRLNIAMTVVASAFGGLVIVFVREYIRGLREQRVVTGRKAANGFESGSRGE
ncbi:MAG: hypothetical protein ACOYXU_02955 [Nitrospirota bacterium]